MLGILSHPVYARLFAAQLVALLGTGLLTVALGLLAYDLAGAQAGAVLGTAFAIKMLAYVGLAPVAAALAERLPRKALLIAADLLRAAVALMLPFVDAVWQIYLLIFVLQAASAAFTPAFQAVIPDILEDEADYTRALSLARLAYDLETLASPALAGLLLLLTGYDALFAGTAMGFCASAALVCATPLPARRATPTRPFRARLTRGLRIYLATPRLRSLLALNLTAAAPGAFVIVNTVVLVRDGYAGSAADLAMALGAFGAGSMLAALALPRLLDRAPDRVVMLGAGALLSLATLGFAAGVARAGLPPWSGFLAAWAAAGLLYAMILTPAGRLLRRSANPEDRPALFAAQFALSHACWLVAYPVAGWAGAAFGPPATLAILGLLGLGGAVLAARLWPAGDPQDLPHDHPELGADHPHLRDHRARNSRHRHIFVIDDLHRGWPRHG